jgi:hypothetical protein
MDKEDLTNNIRSERVGGATANSLEEPSSEETAV